MTGLGTKIFIEKISTHSGSIYFKKIFWCLLPNLWKAPETKRQMQPGKVHNSIDRWEVKKERTSHPSKTKDKGYENKIGKYGKGGIQSNSEYGTKCRRTSCRFRWWNRTGSGSDSVKHHLYHSYPHCIPYVPSLAVHTLKTLKIWPRQKNNSQHPFRDTERNASSRQATFAKSDLTSLPM